jgi:hypothetical protein
MMCNKLLTIGIPAFERNVRVKQTIVQVRGVIEGHESDVEILVIDDQSSDDTWMHIKDECYGPVRGIQNPKRLGFKGNLREIFLKSKSKFTMLMWDDEFLIKNNFDILLKFLDMQSNIALYTTKYFSGGHLIRGSRELESVDLTNIRFHTNHAPGLIFNTQYALEAISNIEEYYYHADNWYPQVLISYYIVLNNQKTLSLPLVICEERDPMISGLGNYSDVNGRWREWLFFRLFFEHLKYIDKSKSELLIRIHEKNMFYSFYKGIYSENTTLSSVYLRSIISNFAWVIYQTLINAVKEILLRRKS